MPVKIWSIVCLICLAGICYAVYRDADLQKYSAKGDLKNRIAGARLQKDGIIPYLYEWKKGDELKYFDAYGDYSSEIGAITGTPFFHSLLCPLTYFTEVNISRIWMVMQYLMLLGIACIAYSFGCTVLQKRLVILIAFFFIFTETWVNSITSGQLYLIIPFLYAVFIFCIKQNKNLYLSLAGGVFISLILVRPNAILLFSPFLLLLKTATLKKTILFLILPLLMVGYILGSKHQRTLWSMYKMTVAAHVNSHQREKPVTSHVVKIAVSPNLDNINNQEERVFYSENGNFFVLVKRIAGVKRPTGILVASGLGIVVLL